YPGSVGTVPSVGFRLGDRPGPDRPDQLVEVAGTTLLPGLLDLTVHLRLVSGADDVAEDTQRGRTVGAMRQSREGERHRRVGSGLIVDQDRLRIDRCGVDDCRLTVTENDRLGATVEHDR